MNEYTYEYIRHKQDFLRRRVVSIKMKQYYYKINQHAVPPVHDFNANPRQCRKIRTVKENSP